MSDPRSRPDGRRPLAELERLPVHCVGILANLWITTIEELVAIASTEEGRSHLLRLLSLEAGDLEHLLLDAREALGTEAYAALSTAAPGGPLGAIPPDEDVSAFPSRPGRPAPADELED